MNANSASRTALATAYLRAAHQILDGTPLLFADPVALPLLGPQAAGEIAAALPRYQSPFGRGLRSHVCLRARFAEDKLADAAARGVRWYVLVGAGFDTFALRQPDWARALRILEIDHPATQDAKLTMMAKAGFAMADNVRFLSADFMRQSLAEILARCEIPADDGVCFSCLGVSMYLDATEVEAMLAAMAAASRDVSLTLSFTQPTQERFYGDVQMAKYVAGLGEPFLSLFTPDEIADKLASHGFLRQEFLTREKARRDYFTPPRRGIPAPHNTTIVWTTNRSI
jgi:methyltransferase (TIGR00027 family)